MPTTPSYFLIAVSTRANVELCIRHALAGFTSSQSGLWTYCELREGDFVSFLYGARIRNLYRVASREAILNASDLPPWPDITFIESGKTYSFPYRLHLRLLRSLDESLVRSEFAYVAENLLLRAGYAKTHFQADQTTLQAVSQIGDVREIAPTPLVMPPYKTFDPLFTQSPSQADGVTTFSLREVVLQSVIRAHLKRQPNLRKLLTSLALAFPGDAPAEVLGEKALSQGHIDILIKEAVPFGGAKKIVIEVKRDVGADDDLEQVQRYAQELGSECVGAVVIARRFRKNVQDAANRAGISLVTYAFDNADKPVGYDALVDGIRLVEV